MSQSRRELDHDFDLNITAIVDCFTVLITYLLAAASFISLGMVSAESMVSSTASTGPQMNVESRVQLTVEVIENDVVRFSLWRGDQAEKRDFSLGKRSPAGVIEGDDQIIAYAAQLKEKNPELDQAIVASDPKVPYGNYVHAIDLVKKNFKVYLANGGI